MLIDEVNITIKAGNGGDGLVHFYHDRWRPKGGPDGGNGGDGGSVYFKGVSDISRLNQFRHQKEFNAQPGQSGGPNQKTGKNGQDLILELPIGSVVSYDNGTVVEISTIKDNILAAKGGRGGKGNYYYRSANNQTPQEAQPGQKTIKKNLNIQLKLIADVGLIGLPNVGKTSLLNELTHANAKVANYAFTTLEPNLGVSKGGKIIADIPGLIENASLGKGLGFKFLKHIERTKLLIHCLSSESKHPLEDYQIVRHELENYSQNLAKKPELIILTKSDLIDKTTKDLLIKTCQINLTVSILDNKTLKQLNDLIAKKLR